MGARCERLLSRGLEQLVTGEWPGVIEHCPDQDLAATGVAAILTISLTTIDYYGMNYEEVSTAACIGQCCCPASL
jgi:hypothetical protein